MASRSLASIATAPPPGNLRCQYGTLPGRWRIPRPDSTHAEWVTLSDRCQVNGALSLLEVCSLVAPAMFHSLPLCVCSAAGLSSTHSHNQPPWLISMSLHSSFVHELTYHSSEIY